MEEGNNTGKVIGALLVGVAVGGALGILFAPDKGSRTRAKIVGNTEDLAESVKLKFNTLLEEAKAEFEALTTKMHTITSNGETALK